MVRRMMAIGLTLGMCSFARAHEGHGTPGEGHTVTHYVLNPLHLPLLVLVAITGVALVYIGRKYLNPSRRKLVR